MPFVSLWNFQGYDSGYMCGAVSRIWLRLAQPSFVLPLLLFEQLLLLYSTDGCYSDIVARQRHQIVVVQLRPLIYKLSDRLIECISARSILYQQQI